MLICMYAGNILIKSLVGILYSRLPLVIDISHKCYSLAEFNQPNYG